MRLFFAALFALSTTVVAIAADKYPATGGDIEITPLIHSSVQIEFGGKVIQVDPWSAGDLSKAKPADLILVGDDQDHHLDPAAIAKLRKPGAPVIITANGKEKVPDGIVLKIGESTVQAGISVKAIPAYDLTPGNPEHPKGKSNGYVLTLGGKTIYLLGVTQCVPEAKAVKDVYIAFMPLNIPPDRMKPAEAAECAKALKPKFVYLYHYDQAYASRKSNPNARGGALPDGITVDQSVQMFRDALKGEPIEFKMGAWYP